MKLPENGARAAAGTELGFSSIVCPRIFELEIALLVMPQSCWEAPGMSVAIFSVLC